ncbi:oxidoreductase [Legionella beliardensis]|uniref:Oxidoreductase n=1 Tax=Legionella beliardensis TaxID=91822 RepID=A0A378HZR7_9GAMM|nr:Gfo/Idh/MocA family oxidoreductase [Legionella beliardensis]STX27960.1 oxidoreductase [Legionella beliardensis]
MKKLRYGMIGGGIGSMMGDVHIKAAQGAKDYVLVCGAFSRSPEKSLAFKNKLNYPELRLYPTFEEMLNQEAMLPEQERMQVVSILTPNHLHFAAASQALRLGFHVILEKPITLTLAEAKELQVLASKYQRKVCVNYSYGGYTKVKEARHLIEQGLLGKIRKVEITFHQDWLYKAFEKDNPQAAWRTDPTQSGLAGTTADLGTHAFYLAEYMTGLKITQLYALIAMHVEGRKLDDDASVLLKFNNNATGIISVMQMAVGENNLTISIYGNCSTLKWEFNNRNLLKICTPISSPQLFKPVKNVIFEDTKEMEQDYQALATHYRNFAQDINALSPTIQYPTLIDGIRGMAWIEAVIQSHLTQHWVNVEDILPIQEEIQDITEQAYEAKLV